MFNISLYTYVHIKRFGSHLSHHQCEMLEENLTPILNSNPLENTRKANKVPFIVILLIQTILLTLKTQKYCQQIN